MSLQPDRLEPGTYTLRFERGSRQGDPARRWHRTRVAISFVLGANSMVTALAAIESDDSDRPLQATVFPNAHGKLEIVDYAACRTDVVEDLPSAPTARGFLVETVGQLPPYAGGPPGGAGSLVTDDGEVRVEVTETSAGRLAGRVVEQTDHGTGELLSRLDKFTLKYEGRTGELAKPPGPRCPSPRM